MICVRDEFDELYAKGSEAGERRDAAPFRKRNSNIARGLSAEFDNTLLIFFSRAIFNLD